MSNSLGARTELLGQENNICANEIVLGQPALQSVIRDYLFEPNNSDRKCIHVQTKKSQISLLLEERSDQELFYCFLQKIIYC